MELIVEFRGGPCDGLACRSDSADRIACSIALVWSLMALGRPTSAMLPGSLGGRRRTSTPGPRRIAVYKVTQRTIETQTVTSLAVYCAGADLGRFKRPEMLSPALSGPLGF